MEGQSEFRESRADETVVESQKREFNTPELKDVREIRSIADL